MNKNQILLYKKLYHDIDKLLKELNPCGIHIAGDGKPACNGMQPTSKTGISYLQYELCCNECKHLTKKGCKCMSLFCKIYLCNRAYLCLIEIAKISTVKRDLVIELFLKIQEVSQYIHMDEITAYRRYSLTDNIKASKTTI